MSKVYEALLHARAERIHTEIPKPQIHPQVRPLVQATVPTAISTSNFEREMLTLDQSLTDLTRQTQGTLLQFMGIQGGEGTSCIVRELASLRIGKHRQSVLILDAYRHQPQLHHFALTPSPSLEQSIHNDWDLNEAIHPIDATELSVSSLYSTMSGGAEHTSLTTQENMFNKIRHRFDTILIDAPPVCASIDGLSLCNQVDGIVLVVEAEKSKSVVIQNAKDRIIQSGGNLLGIVFNKQYHYIPEWMYQRL